MKKAVLLPLCFLLLISMQAQVSIMVGKKKGKQALFIDYKRITDFKYQEIDLYNTAGVIVKVNDLYGLINLEGEETIPPIYQRLEPQSRAKFVVKKDNKMGIIDSLNNVLIPIDYNFFRFTATGVYVVKKDGKFGIIDSLNTMLIPFDYDDINAVTDQYALVNQEDVWFYVDYENDPVQYDTLVFKPEVYPSFPKCKEKFDKERFQNCTHAAYCDYLEEHLTYTEEARKKYAEGTVKIDFLVSPEGKILNPKVSQELGFGLDQKLVKLFKEMPNWQPGLYKGKKVWTAISAPIYFDFDWGPNHNYRQWEMYNKMLKQFYSH